MKKVKRLERLFFYCQLCNVSCVIYLFIRVIYLFMRYECQRMSAEETEIYY